MMEWREVQSSSMTRIGYDPKTCELQVEFASTGLYAYYKVPKEVADGLLNAKSKGSYLFQSIVGKFEYVCLRRAPRKERKNAAPEETQGKRRKKIQPI